MNYNQALEYIHSLGMFSHSAGLERITAVLEKLDNPQNDLMVIHIAGTNGKGSVCTFIASALSEEGLKVGLFTSPFIVDFRERVQINGQYISENDLCRLTEAVRATDVPLTEFEFITAVAFLYFKENRCDAVVLETGLGGRFDATNVCSNVLCNVITKIGLDHTAVLGDTIEQIAAEKCGIIKCKNVVTDPFQLSAALDVIKNHSGGVKQPDVKNLKIVSSDITGSRFVYKGNTYNICMAGEHQIYNAITAIEALWLCGLDISQDAIKSGLEKAFIPARLQSVSKTPTVILDGAHNPDAAAALAKAIKPYSGRAVAIFSAMRDKDYKQVMQEALPLFGSVIVVPLNMPRAESAERLADAARQFCDDVQCAQNLETALKTAAERAGENPIFVFGSLYLAAETNKLLNNQ